ncbi:MAG: MFS transporter [Deltaproteobacteria bacterium]|nr:MFS transporter [Deltaproteobacteria bacterium]
MNKKGVAFSGNFGAKGWVIILFAFFLFWMGSAWPITALNVIIPKFNEINGWGTAAMNNLTTLANWISLIGAAIFAWYCDRVGPKVVIAIGCFLGAISLFFWARCGSLIEFTLWQSVLNIAGTAFCQIGLGALIANWFPTKKGLAMGWLTIGAVAQGMTIAKSQYYLIDNYSFKASFDVYAVAFLILTIVCILFIKSNPEEAGAFPDNDRIMTREKVEKLRTEGEIYKKTSPWTVAKLLMTKETWLIGISTGILALFVVGIMSNFIPLCVSRGLTTDEAVTLMIWIAPVVAVFSYLWGFADQKIGTRKTTIIMFAWFIATILLALVPSRMVLYVALFMVSSAMGGANNLAISITGSVFGRYDFAKAWGVIYIMNVIVRSFGFSLVGGLAGVTGSYTCSFISMIAVSALGLILMFLVKERLLGRNFLDESELMAR